MSEVWKDIPGYEGRYQASSEGRIRSVPRFERCVPKDGKQPYTRFHSGQVLSTCLGSNGYDYVGLRKQAASNNSKYEPVFHLVAITFLGPRPDGAVICHTDGNKQNNSVINLRYDSESENRIDVYRCGGKYGKLSTDQARDVKRRLARGESKRSIAQMYGVSRTAIRYIAKGEHFGWLSI